MALLRVAYGIDTGVTMASPMAQPIGVSALGRKQTQGPVAMMSVFWGNADIDLDGQDVRS